MRLIKAHVHTVHSDESIEVLHSQQRMGQLPDEQLQKASSIVLLQLFPWERAFIKRRLKLLAQQLG